MTFPTISDFSSHCTAGTEPHQQRVPRSQRGGEVVEPMLSEQWFVRTSGMADRAVQAVRSKEIAILPERFEKVGLSVELSSYCRGSN